MKITVQQISSLEKVRRNDTESYQSQTKRVALAGERICYQVYLHTDDQAVMSVSVNSRLKEHVHLFRVRDVMMDRPIVIPTDPQDYITQEACMMPDVLIPLEEMGNLLYVDKVPVVMWVNVDIPKDAAPGSYPVELELYIENPVCVHVETIKTVMDIQVIAAAVPEQKLLYTRWMHLDCIAVAHNVEIFSEQHWQLIERYIACAADLGINMLMVPVHTPPLDTQVNTCRPCVQLVDIEKTQQGYSFDFHRLHRYIGLCKRYHIHHFEIAHMFTQWGAKFTPNIQITENGKKEYRFGWHVSSSDISYLEFLRAYIPAIVAEMEKEGVAENTYFHISDEPSLQDEESYRTAAGIIRPLIGKCRSYDTLSACDFYEKGLVECPVTIVDKIHDFLKLNIENQWVYYCCGPNEVYPNCFMALRSYRVRILGFLLYRYQIKGFLQWGFNFYNTIRSIYPVSPYLTTSCDGAFPSGDAFIVYPGKDGPYTSIRGQITLEAMQDMNICYALEERIGREAVEKIIDEAAGKTLRFDDYPRNNQYILDLRAKIVDAIAANLK